MVENRNGEKTVYSYHKQELQYNRESVSTIEEVIKKKGNTCILNWKGYYNSLNSWIYKSEIL